MTYFGMHAADLTVLQAATLAGGPARAVPVRPDREPVRQRVPPRLLARPDGEVRLHHPGRRGPPEGEACCGTIPDGQAHDQGAAGSEYFVDYTRQYLMDKYYGSDGVRRRPARHDLARPGQAARRHTTRSTRTSPTPTTTPTPRSSRSTRRRAQILAMVGGRNFNKSKLNLATFKGGTGARRVGVQGVHPGGRDAGGLQPERVLAGTGDDHDPRPGVRRPRRSLDPRRTPATARPARSRSRRRPRTR